MSATLIIKCTRKCNLRCNYCHDWRDKARPISFSNLAKLTKESISKYKNVSFIWHGGEPLLLGVTWFEKALILQKLAIENTSNISNVIQTNGTLLNEKWCKFLKEHSISVGLSIDGPQFIHDLTRIDIRGNGSYGKVKDALALLKKYGVPYGVLVVVSEEILKAGPENIYNWLKKENITSVGLLPQRPDTVGLDSIREPSSSSEYLSRDKYNNFLIEMGELWWNDDGQGPRIREFEGFVNGLISQKPSLCIYQGSCVGKYFGVDPNGDIYHCDRFIPDPNYKISNISDKNFSFNNEKLQVLKTEALKQEASSKKCRWHSVCHGGCPHDRYVDKPGWESRGNCCGMDNVIEFFAHKISKSIPEEIRVQEYDGYQ